VRTAEQRDADEALTAAIEQVLRAYGEGAWNGVLTEYIVITSQQNFDDDGEGLTAVGSIFRDGEVPLHRALGLAEYAAARYRKRITTDTEE
jgi:hypothetical protein